jgi:hypothetical protein
MLAALQAVMHDSSLLQMVAPRRIECRAPPPPPRSSRAAATAAWQVPRPAPCSRRPRRLLVHAARARASRRRAPRAAAHERLGIDYGLCYGLALVRSGVHMQRCQPGLSAWRIVRGLDSLTAQYSPLGGTLRIRTGAVRSCGSSSAGLVAAHQCTHSAILRSKPRIGHYHATARVQRRQP